MHPAYLRRLFVLPNALLLSIADVITAQQACRFSQPLTAHVVHEQAISIKTNVLHNTTFYPIEEIAVTVSNAPTVLDGVTTFHCMYADA